MARSARTIAHWIGDDEQQLPASTAGVGGFRQIPRGLIIADKRSHAYAGLGEIRRLDILRKPIARLCNGLRHLNFDPCVPAAGEQYVDRLGTNLIRLAFQRCEQLGA